MKSELYMRNKVLISGELFLRYVNAYLAVC